MHDDPAVTEEPPLQGQIEYRSTDRETALQISLALNTGIQTSAEQLVKDAEVIRQYLSPAEP